MESLSRTLLAVAFGAVLFLPGCALNKPVADTDMKLRINLKRDFVLNNKSIHYNGTTILETLEVHSAEEALAWFIIVPISLPFESAIKHFWGTEIYFYPEGYEQSYTQRIDWGRNVVYLPQELSNREAQLVIRMQGDFVGTWKGSIDTGKAKIVELE